MAAIFVFYARRMFDVGASLHGALDAASSQLAIGAQKVARSQTPLGTAASDAGMAQAARQALFMQALLSAVHARLAEIKTVTK